MSLQAAILASLLFDNACCGYELSKEHINSCVSTVWQVPQQQIYRELKRMEASGWIVSRRVCQENRLDKKVYEITDTGTEQLQQWISTPIDTPAIRNPLLVKVFSGHIVSCETVLSELERHQQLHHAHLEELERCCLEHFPTPSQLPERARYIYLVLLHRIGEEQHWIEWCQKAKRFLGKPASKASDKPSEKPSGKQSTPVKKR